MKKIYLILLFLLSPTFIYAGVPTSAYIGSETGLTHLYHLDDSNELLDVKLTNNLTKGGTITSVSGKFNEARQGGLSAGANYMSFTNDTMLTSNFTYELWIKRVDLSASTLMLTYNSGGGTGNGQTMYIHVEANGTVRIQLQNNSLNSYLRSTSNLTASTFNHIAITKNNTVVKLYFNGVQEDNNTVALGYTPNCDNQIQQYCNFLGAEALGAGKTTIIDEVAIFSYAKTYDAIPDSINFVSPTPLNEDVSNKNVILNLSCSQPTHNIGLYLNYSNTPPTQLIYNGTNQNGFNISNYINQEGTYYFSGQCYNASTILNTSVYYFNYVINDTLTFSNYINYPNFNLTRNLGITIEVQCDNNVSVLRYINNNFNSSYNLNCISNEKINYSSLYQHNIEGFYNISFLINSTTRNKFYNFTFKSDLYNPNITNLNLSSFIGFNSNNPFITLRCIDTQSPNLTYSLDLNEVNLFFNATLNNTLFNYSLANTPFYSYEFTYKCGDYFGNTTQTLNGNLYRSVIYLIDEKNNSLFDVRNITGALIYFDDNSSYYNFKQYNTSAVNITTISSSKIRIELTYAAGIILRYIDTSLFNESIRVCANKEGVTHYQQLAYSVEERSIKIKNIFSKCYVTGDQTRFAYQDSKSLKFYTIDSTYELYTTSDSVDTYLAVIDGGLQSLFNIDALVFRTTQYTVNTKGEALSVQKSTTSNESIIYYKNLNNDTKSASLLIKRMDTRATIYTQTEFSNPNEWLLYFNYMSFTNITDNTLFYIELTTTKNDGTVDTIKYYFNNLGKTGQLKPEIAFIVALILIIFGLTFASAKVTLSWFGIVVEVIALILLALSTWEWYILLLMFSDVILIVYTFIIMGNQNYPTIGA